MKFLSFKPWDFELLFSGEQFCTELKVNIQYIHFSLSSKNELVSGKYYRNVVLNTPGL